jgi:hypothetical protein
MKLDFHNMNDLVATILMFFSLMEILTATFVIPPVMARSPKPGASGLVMLSMYVIAVIAIITALTIYITKPMA